MTRPQVQMQSMLLDAYRFLKPKDEFTAAQLLGAVLLVGKHFPLEMQRIPQQEWQQKADAYLDELLSQLRQSEARDEENRDQPSLTTLAFDSFSFQRRLLGTPPATRWPSVIVELCALLAPVWSGDVAVGLDWGQALFEVVLGRPKFVKALGPTPPAAAQLAAGLLDAQAGQRVLNLQCRLGHILRLLAMSEIGPSLSLNGTGSDPQALQLCALFLLLSDVSQVQVNDLPLSSDVPLLGLERHAYDRLVAHPPLEATIGTSVQYTEELVIEQVLGTLHPDGRAVVIVSSGYLHRKRPDPVMRRELVASGLLRAVMALPGSPRDPGGPPTLLILERPRQANDILFLDLSEIEPAIWLRPQVIEGLIRAPQALLEEAWSPLLHPDGTPRPRWRVVPQAQILSDADLSPSRYLSTATEKQITPSALLETQRAYQSAQQHLQTSIARFDQTMDELLVGKVVDPNQEGLSLKEDLG